MKLTVKLATVSLLVLISTAVQAQQYYITAVPPIVTVTPVETARAKYEDARDFYNAKKVRTKKEHSYVVGLWHAYATEYKREMFPPAKYDHPYTGKLTIERVTDPAAVRAHCPNTKKPLGCAHHARDLSWCRVYVVSDEYINQQYSAETRKLFGYTYENFLRHELGHCNGWPSDHSRD
jgi:hypothetical protein